MMTQTTISSRTQAHSVVDEPAMVMGFLPAALHAKLRRMASEQGCSEAFLVSKFVREALTNHRMTVRRELQ